MAEPWLSAEEIAAGVSMNIGSTAAKRYALSFTTGGLLSREAAVLAPVYVELRDWAKVRDRAVNENLLQSRTHSTGVRRVRETVRRLSVLSGRELEILPDLTATERGHLMWAAACRRYDLIAEFGEEVLRERFLTLTGTVSHEDYDSFYRAKAMWHDELDSVSAATYQKLRQVLFKMMVEAGLVTSKGAIEPALFSARVAELLNERTPSDVRFFPTRTV
ncbi:DUF1819 family protein [Microbacterium gorillae]|uniref:DUF1819 family protein n=1 Tax=Microbacterium gorillae TaxID=1231063 RepID=UPI003D96B911